MRKFDILKIFVVLSTAFSAACSDNEPEWSPFKQQASINDKTETIIGSNQPVSTLKTSGDPSLTWTATISADGEWCSFDSAKSVLSASGKTGASATIYTSNNENDTERTATIRVRFSDGTTVTCLLRQSKSMFDPNYEHLWGEQPSKATVDNPDYIYKTYYTTLNDDRYVRNYSVCFDKSTKVSRWVAYPVHSVYTSGKNYTTFPSTTKGRTNAWAFDDAVTEYYGNTTNYNKAYTIISRYMSSIDAYDTYTEPIIEQKYQQDIVNGSYGTGNLQRGHMLPSASRYNSWSTNAQTFYATNMMPQNGYFNGGVWGDVENYTRSNSCSDTLFVVVGTLFEPGYKISSQGRQITVPSRCYKLLLRTKAGNTKKFIGDITDASQIQAIGFIFDNTDTYGSMTDAQHKPFIQQHAVSIAEIEELAGFTFYRNLNPAIADKVKSTFNINDWNGFK